MPLSDADLRDESVLTYRCAVTPHALWLLRRLLEQWLAERRVTGPDVDDVIVIVNELCSSAVVHGGGEEIDVTARIEDGEIVVDVVGHDPKSKVDPDEIALARSLSASLFVDESARRVTLSSRRPISVGDQRTG